MAVPFAFYSPKYRVLTQVAPNPAEEAAIENGFGFCASLVRTLDYLFASR